MKFLGKIKQIYVGLDIKDMLFALVILLAVICTQLANINRGVSEVAHEIWSMAFDIKYK